MKRAIFALLLGLYMCPALAETNWMSTAEFEAQVTGRATKVYDLDGTLFGTEYFLAKRRTIWQLARESKCYAGAWTPRDDQICFRYEGGFGNCYRYYSAPDKIVGVDWVGGVQTTSSHDLVLSDDLIPNCSAD